MDRFNSEWYRKKIREIPRIKGHLLDKIEQHRPPDLDITREDLGQLEYYDIFEIAVAAVNTSISVTLGAGADWSNNKDGKVSIVRRHSSGQGYSAGITGCSNKHHITTMVYEAINDTFYYFDFPVQTNAIGNKMAEHTIPFDPNTGLPKRSNYMWRYECATFEDMCVGKTIHPAPEYVTALSYNKQGKERTRKIRAANNTFHDLFSIIDQRDIDLEEERRMDDRLWARIAREVRSQ